MLPIANRKTLEIPHGLAALAAVICLVLAFATDQASLQQERQADRNTATAPLQQAVEESGKEDSAKTRLRERWDWQGNLNLIPWLPVPGGSRG